MFTESALKKTANLSKMERVMGTGGLNDYFVIHAGKVNYCLKVDFETNYAGSPLAIFARIRMVKADGVDIFSVADFIYDNFNHQTLRKDLGVEGIEATNFKVDTKRASFVIVSKAKLGDYGDPETEYDALMVALRKDMKELGTRIYKAMRVLKEVPASAQKVIHYAMMDFVELYKPMTPKGKKKTPVASGDKVVPIGGHGNIESKPNPDDIAAVISPDDTGTEKMDDALATGLKDTETEPKK
jgi:hypothetical protein